MKDIPVRHESGIFSAQVGNHCKNQYLADVRVDCLPLHQVVSPECAGTWVLGPLGL